jgi:hypothetical protein
MVEFLLSFSIDQSFKRLSKLVTGTLENLNFVVILNFFFLQKYGTAAIFFLYGYKDVPSAEARTDFDSPFGFEPAKFYCTIFKRGDNSTLFLL